MTRLTNFAETGWKVTLTFLVSGWLKCKLTEGL